MSGSKPHLRVVRVCCLCRKNEQEVAHLVQGIDGHVCDECVGQCLVLLCDLGWVPPTVTIKTEVEVQERKEGDHDG